MAADIRIIVVEDSATVRRYLVEIIQETAGMCVVGEARNGAEAVTLVTELRPDVVSMDIRMPQMDGLEATRQIMATCPTPVVVVSGLLDVDVQLSLQALEAGALAVVRKPPDRDHPDFAMKERQLVSTLRAMSAVKVVSRRNLARDARKIVTEPLGQPKPEVIAIGASTGGPSALSRVLKGLPADFPVPLVVVQHMPDEFVPGLVNWLDKSTPLQVRIAQHDMLIEAGQVLVAPGMAHVRVVRANDQLKVALSTDDYGTRYLPSVDVLLQSVAETCGANAVGVILTGMGDDGAEGLLAMRRAGSYTLAQDAASSTVFGMPRAAIERDAAQSIVTLLNLPTKLMKLV